MLPLFCARLVVWQLAKLLMNNASFRLRYPSSAARRSNAAAEQGCLFIGDGDSCARDRNERRDVLAGGRGPSATAPVLPARVDSPDMEDRSAGRNTRGGTGLSRAP